MTQINILSKKEKTQITEQLNKQFGIGKTNGIITTSGRERLFLFQGSLTEKEIMNLERARINIERIGVYFAKEINGQIRLSIEGTHLFKDQITKNIFELNDEQAEQWMKGNELDIQTGKNDFLVMKYKDDFLGTGKASEKKISNFIPKNRRLKENS
ncbi:MAG: hypothetical protein ABIA78_01520 [archaeon]